MNRKLSSSAHQFAFFYQTLPARYLKNDSFTITDVELIGRMTHIVRLGIGDTALLFNGIHCYELCIETVDRKAMRVRVVNVFAQKTVQPSVGILLPVLKKSALEEAIYGCVESGISNIQLVMTQKSNHSYHHAKEKERLQRIVIAACEQAKQFTIPEIRTPLPLPQALLLHKVTPVQTLLFADPEGTPFFEVLTSLHANKQKNKTKHIDFLVGPEGSLTPEETRLVYEYGALGVRLTPTILRAQQAAVVLAGALVSSVYQD